MGGFMVLPPWLPDRGQTDRLIGRQLFLPAFRTSINAPLPYLRNGARRLSMVRLLGEYFCTLIFIEVCARDIASRPTPTRDRNADY